MAVVTYAVRNNQLAGRNVKLHPLTQTFVARTGGSPASMMGGTNNSSGSPIGADWYTYDGSNSWVTPGGDYDSSVTVLQVASSVGTKAVFTWDITGLVNNPTTRAELQLDGMLLDVQNEIPYPAQNTQQFVSLYSADSAAYTGNTATQPTVTFTVVPEPASALFFAGVVPTVIAQRRRRAERVAVTPG